MGAFVIGLALSLCPSIVAQLRGHQNAREIIALNLAAPVLAALALTGPGGQPHNFVFLLAAPAAWLAALIWSLGK